MQNMALGNIRASVEGPNSVDTGARPVRWARVVAAIRPANRRVRTLYVPLGPVLPELAKLARCRVCCGLRYHTQRCGPERRADLMVLRAAKRINPNVRGAPEDFQAPPPKPSRMRWARYKRLCDAFYEAHEARNDVYLFGTARFHRAPDAEARAPALECDAGPPPGRRRMT